MSLCTLRQANLSLLQIVCVTAVIPSDVKYQCLTSRLYLASSYTRIAYSRHMLLIHVSVAHEHKHTDLTTVYSRVKELGEGTLKTNEMLQSRFQEQEIDSKRLLTLSKQYERFERTLHRLERKVDDVNTASSGHQ